MFAAMCSCGCLDRTGSIGATEGLYQDCNALIKVRKKWNLCSEENYCYFSISSNYRRIVLSLHNSLYIKKKSNLAPLNLRCGALTLSMEISVKNFRQMVLVFFLSPKTGTGLSCTIYKVPVKLSLSHDMKPGTSNPNKWNRKIRSFG